MAHPSVYKANLFDFFIFFLLVRQRSQYLVSIYHILKEEKTSYEPGSTFCKQREHDAVKQRFIRNGERLGYHEFIQEKRNGLHDQIKE